MKEFTEVQSIRDEIIRAIGKKVCLKADKGRRKFVTKVGTIQQAYPSLFTVKISNEYEIERTVSYTYSDILTATVELDFI